MKNWLDDSARSFGRHQQAEPDYAFRFSVDEPIVIEKGMIYIVGERPNYWMITFWCPCGCKKVIALNLLKGISPRWKFKTRRQKISIAPSVWRRVGCQSHFHIRKGKVEWSFDEPVRNQQKNFYE